jgi:hypothetical protein
MQYKILPWNRNRSSTGLLHFTRGFFMPISVKWMSVVCLGLLVACGDAAWAQSPKDNIVIFAQAGRVNHLIGSSQVRHTPNGPAKLLAAGDNLSVGDAVETGAGTQLELLLNPGSFLRVSENAQFQLTANPKESIRIALIRGSAVIESVNGLGRRFSIQVITPTGMAFFEHYGIYRVNVKPDGSEFIAHEGSLILGSRQVAVMQGERVTVTPAGVSPVTKLDAKASDGLDTWSRSRADTLAKANRKLDSKSLLFAMRGAETDEGLNAALQGQIGFWANSSVHGFAVFVPFFSLWRSPYGYSHTNGTRPTGYVDNRGGWPRGTPPGPVSSGRPIIQEPYRPQNSSLQPSARPSVNQPPRPPGH